MATRILLRWLLLSIALAMFAAGCSVDPAAVENERDDDRLIAVAPAANLECLTDCSSYVAVHDRSGVEVRRVSTAGQVLLQPLDHPDRILVQEYLDDESVHVHVLDVRTGTMVKVLTSPTGALVQTSGLQRGRHYVASNFPADPWADTVLVDLHAMTVTTIDGAFAPWRHRWSADENRIIIADRDGYGWTIFDPANGAPLRRFDFSHNVVGSLNSDGSEAAFGGLDPVEKVPVGWLATDESDELVELQVGSAYAHAWFDDTRLAFNSQVGSTTYLFDLETGEAGPEIGESIGLLDPSQRAPWVLTEVGEQATVQNIETGETRTTAFDESMLSALSSRPSSGNWLQSVTDTANFAHVNLQTGDDRNLQGSGGRNKLRNDDCRLQQRRNEAPRTVW